MLLANCTEIVSPLRLGPMISVIQAPLICQQDQNHNGDFRLHMNSNFKLLQLRVEFFKFVFWNLNILSRALIALLTKFDPQFFDSFLTISVTFSAKFWGYIRERGSRLFQTKRSPSITDQSQKVSRVSRQNYKFPDGKHIWAKIDQNRQCAKYLAKKANFGPNLAFFGPKILIFLGVSKSFGANMTEKPPRQLVRLA